MHASWLKPLGDVFNTPQMRALKQFLQQEKAAGKVIYPPGKEMFAALDHAHFDDVKVVILGQDPYHGPGQAHGLCFSVRPGVAVPPSLKNIYRELADDVGFSIPDHGYLMSWADQGVLLLNAVLSVQAHKAGSHQGKGWETFTDSVVQALNDQREGLVFLLWGSHAQRKGAHINTQKHCVLKAPHPSPLSAHRGFFGCRHFSQTNAWLRKQGRSAIDWQLPEKC